MSDHSELIKRIIDIYARTQRQPPFFLRRTLMLLDNPEQLDERYFYGQLVTTRQVGPFIEETHLVVPCEADCRIAQQFNLKYVTYDGKPTLISGVHPTLSALLKMYERGIGPHNPRR